jgi:hypothetical protein
MIAVPLLLIALAHVPRSDTARSLDTLARVDTALHSAVDTAALAPRPLVSRLAVGPAPVRPTPSVSDTGRTSRPRAVDYSDAYYKRLTVHRIGSYTMLPLFAAEYALGQNLMQDASPAGWLKPAHGLVAGGVGVLFGVNTVTGVWNWWDARDDATGRTRRTVHSLLMIASEAGFAATAALAPGRQQTTDYATWQHRQRVHRNVAIGSMALSTAGSALMWFWNP